MRNFQNDDVELQVLSREEMEQVIWHLKAGMKKNAPHRKTAIKRTAWLTLGMFSGLRKAEIATLKWSDIVKGDGFKDFFIPSRAKKGSRMPAMMNEFSKEILERIRKEAGNSRYVFPGIDGMMPQTPNTIYMAWQRMQEKLWGVRLYNIHALRHTAITNFYRCCRDIELTRQFGRHKSYITTQRYVHLVEREKCLEVMAEIESEFRGIADTIRAKPMAMPARIPDGKELAL